MAHVPDYFDFTHLSVEQRLALIGDIWDSIKDEELPPLSEDAKIELLRRSEEMRNDPSIGIPWEEVQARLRERIDDRRG